MYGYFFMLIIYFVDMYLSISMQNVANGVIPQSQTFFFWLVVYIYLKQSLTNLYDLRLLTLSYLNNNKLCSSRPRKRRAKDYVQNEKCANVKFLELESPEGIQNGFLQKDDGINFILMRAITTIKSNIQRQFY